METTKVLIEPVFENKGLLRNFPEFRQVASSLITQSGLLSSFTLKVTHEEGELVNQIKLKKIKIVNKIVNYEETLDDEEITVNFINPKESKIVFQYEIVFPAPGLYWLELEVEPESIETKQRMLNRKPGRGWSKHEKNKGSGKPKKNFLRQPILVVDGAMVEQIKINQKLKYLTWVILFLTAVNVILMVLNQWI